MSIKFINLRIDTEKIFPNATMMKDIETLTLSQLASHYNSL